MRGIGEYIRQQNTCSSRASFIHKTLSLPIHYNIKEIEHWGERNHIRFCLRRRSFIKSVDLIYSFHRVWISHVKVYDVTIEFKLLCAVFFFFLSQQIITSKTAYIFRYMYMWWNTFVIQINVFFSFLSVLFNDVFELIKYKLRNIESNWDNKNFAPYSVRNFLVIHQYLYVIREIFMALPVHTKWWAWVRQRVLFATLLARPSIKRVNFFTRALALWECLSVVPLNTHTFRKPFKIVYRYILL